MKNKNENPINSSETRLLCSVIHLGFGLLTFAHAPISQIPVVLKKFIKISLIIKECPEEILIKLTIVLKILKSS